ncbi:hypothetical protein [Streptacidiphilus rugosus]|uniref:hypothetical protein n=1 Tax=Streptacidiphilus rugosus TaxID=405783 RepID=UPI00056182D1|nr:hypothetical protein [Streptacidiphilus rugosus]
MSQDSSPDPITVAALAVVPTHRVATAPPPNWLGLLSDEERVPHDDASAVRRVLEMGEPSGADPEPLFVAANLLSLVLFRRGRLDAARTLCRAEVGFARSCPPGPHRPRSAALALQPQVNLLRIEGYAGSLDHCLAGLAALERVAAGQDVHTAELEWFPQDVEPDPLLARRVRLLARNIRVADTCKILLRRGRIEELLDQAARFGVLWPGLTAAGLQHAAETPWAARPGAQRPPTAEQLGAGTTQERRLALVRGLHGVAHAFHTGPGGGRAAALRLAHRLDAALSAAAAEGPWASPLTVPRWQGVLGAALLLAGEERRGEELMRKALVAADPGGDSALARGLRLRLDGPADGPAAPVDLAAAERLESQLAEALARVSAALAVRPGPRRAPAGV